MTTLLPAALLAVLVAGCGGGSSGDAGDASAAQSDRALVQTSSSSATARVEPMVRRATPGDDASPVKPRRADRAPLAQRVTLGRAAQTVRGAKALKLSRMGVPEQVGFGRELAQTTTPAATARRLQWQATANGGRVAAISFTSPAATGVRLGLLVQRLPWEATVRVYAQASDTMLELSGSEIMASVNRNIDADGANAAARTYWLPTVDGEESTVEIEMPPGAAADALEIAVPRLSHLFTDATGEQAAEAAATAGRANACLVDINCTTGFSLESNATAKMSFVGTDGFSYVCSGTLLNDKQSSGTPYFLSANHCISLQTEASTLTTYWFYRSASCNSSAVSSSTKTLTGGASLLYASSASDTSFMQLNKTPPAGVQYAGWDPSAPSVTTAVTGVHHPSGDLQKINKGALTEFSSCTDLSNSESFSCVTAAASSGNYLGIQWSSGATQPGSSGSGLYKTVGSTNYLIGQLYGGSSSCFDTSGEDSYGRFDVAYNAALNKWLAPASSAVFRFIESASCSPECVIIFN